MSLTEQPAVQLRHLDRFFIGGEWVAPSSDATIDVIDSATEELFFTVAEAQAADIDRAVAAAREAFDNGPWPRMSHAERADYCARSRPRCAKRGEELGEIWPRESGVLHGIAKARGRGAAADVRLLRRPGGHIPVRGGGAADAGGEFGLLVREPVGVVGAIIPWNAPIGLIAYKVAPALLAGCTVVLKSSPEAPGCGLRPGRDRRGGRPAAGRAQRRHRRPRGLRTAGARSARRQDHLHRFDRGRPADRVDLRRADRALHAGTGRQVGGGDPGRRRCRDGRADDRRRRVLLTGQVCSSLTRIIVTASPPRRTGRGARATFSQVRVGDPFDPETEMGPLA